MNDRHTTRPSLDRLDALMEECRADELLAELWLERALRGDWRFFKLLIEYRNGPATKGDDKGLGDCLDELLRLDL